VVGAIEISRDITGDLNMQKLVMEQEKLASIGRLAAGVAHEINNPMTTILTSAMLIQEDLDSSDPNHEELQSIVDETLRCRRIVTSLLDFARQNKPSRRPVDVKDLVAESIVLTQKQAAFKDVSVDSAIADDLPKVNLDKGQMQQALINLILNAVDACSAGGRIRVSTGLSEDDRKMEFRVSDTGIGIESDKLSSIFDPFFTTKETGNGLGLAITHGIIEQHEGTIEVDSQPGKGTTFTIRIPLQPGDPHVA
jgi:signal transduction histidine kinase